MLLTIFIEHTHPNEKLKLPFGGIQTQLLELLSEYQRIKKLKILLITRYSEYPNTSKNFKIYQINKFRGSILGKLYFYLSSFYKMVIIHKKKRIDLINVHTYSYSVITPLLLRLIFKIPILMKIPIDFKSHIKEISMMRSNTLIKKIICYSWLKLFQKYFLGKVDYIRVINNRMVEDLRELKYPKERILRISNGIEIKKFTNLNKNAHEGVSYGFAGRLSQFKNLNYMLMEFKPYFEMFPSDKLLIYGDGPELPSINAFIERNNLANNIFVLGFERDITRIYNNIDVLIDPSYGQGISNANLEAMSTNTLIIASNVYGNIDLIKNGENGLLFEPRKKGALLEKLLYYKNAPKQAKLMTQKARRTVSEEYNIKSITNRIIEFVFNRN